MKSTDRSSLRAKWKVCFRTVLRMFFFTSFFVFFLSSSCVPFSPLMAQKSNATFRVPNAKIEKPNEVFTFLLFLSWLDKICEFYPEKQDKRYCLLHVRLLLPVHSHVFWPILHLQEYAPDTRTLFYF